jgi:hypothetical protein
MLIPLLRCETSDVMEKYVRHIPTCNRVVKINLYMNITFTEVEIDLKHNFLNKV